MLITKKEAKENGLYHFFTGIPCLHGHISNRFVSGGTCTECSRIAHSTDEFKASRRTPQARARANLLASAPDRKVQRFIHARKPETRLLANSSERKIKNKLWRDQPHVKEKINKFNALEKNKLLRYKYMISEAGKESSIRHNANRRSKTRGQYISKGLSKKLLKLQRGLCATCEKKLDKYHMDHILPICQGGPNLDFNIQLLCPPCNMRKNRKHPIEWAKENGKLL